VPLGHPQAGCHYHHADPQEWSYLEGGLRRRKGKERGPPSHQAFRPSPLEALDRLPRPESIEAKRRCLNAFGERIASRDPDRQTAEIHTCIALMNRFTALGTAEIVRVA
jgi:hypothetical protein